MSEMINTRSHSNCCQRMASFDIGKIAVLLVTLGTLISSGSRVSNSSINHIGVSHIYDLDELDDVITTYMRERKIPGASVAISKGGQFLMRKGYGRASAQRLMTPWALMRVGSVSKIITAVSILRLYDEGRLELDSKVFGSEGILSEYDIERDSGSERGRGALLNITVRYLLQHTAGWDHRQIGDPLFQKDLPTASNPNTNAAALSKGAIVRFMLNQTLQYTPGTRYSYSNFGYMLLGLVVERVAGVTYESYTRDLLRLLGIYRMKIGGTLKEEADVSEVEYFSRYPHDRVQSILNATQLVPPPYGGFNMAVIDSSCGWISSSSDLVRLVESIADPSSISRSSVALLSNSTVQQMLTRPSYTNASVWYGLGLVVEEGGHAYWHSGTLDGSTSIVSHDEYGFTWAALLNCKLDPNDLGDFLRYAIRRVFLDGPLTAGGRDPPHENSLNSIMPLNRQSNVVDSTSSDGKNIVKLMIPDYKFAEVLASVSTRLYRLAWIDAYDELGYVFFNAVWTQNDGTRWRAYFDLTSSRYRKRFKARVAQGYRLSHVETYVSKRRLRYAAIFVKDEWPEWTAYDSYSPQRHKTEFFRLLHEGYRLVVQSVTEYKGQVYVAAVYDKIFLGEIRVRLGLTLDEFTEELEKQLASGRILSYVQSYENRGQLRFSAVWSPRTTRYWAVSQAMTKYMLLNKLHEYAVVNVPLSCVTAYHNDEVLYFAALWR